MLNVRIADDSKSEPPVELAICQTEDGEVILSAACYSIAEIRMDGTLRLGPVPISIAKKAGLKLDERNCVKVTY